MAIHRQRVLISGQNEKPTYIQLRAQTVNELNDKIVQAYIDCGRINEFTLPEDNGKPEEYTNFKEYAEEWMRVYKEPNLKHKTLSTYQGFLNTHIFPAFGGGTIENINPDDIQRFLNDRKHLSKKTIKEYLALLRQIFNAAIDDGLIDDNPAINKKLILTSNTQTPRKALTIEQYNRIIGSIYILHSAEDRRMIALFALAGLRRGEALGLRWQEVDIPHKRINITQNVTHKGNRAVVGTTKTENGVRSLPLSEKLSHLLYPIYDFGYVIGGMNPISLSAYDYRMNRIRKQINLYGATAHTLRHTYLTVLEGTGIDLKTLQYIAGHSHVQTTMNIYVHTQEENINKAGELIDRLIDNYSQGK